MADAFFTALPGSGDQPGGYVGTAATAGPWDPRLMHGGPPSALLARAVETLPGAWPSTVVRLAVELLGPVPVGPVTVSATIARAGRSVELVEAELSAGGRVAVRARAWRVRLAELDLPAEALPTTVSPPRPTDDDLPPTGWSGGFMAAMQCRFLTGGWNVPGPATVWARQRVPLVAGEAPTGLQRLMVLADCGNGVSAVLPIADWLFINPDLTVHLDRYPTGEWLCLDAATTADPRGFGLASSRLYDEEGLVGHGAQSLFVSHR